MRHFRYHRVTLRSLTKVDHLRTRAASLEPDSVQALVFAQIVSESPDPICQIGRDLRFSYANTAFENCFGVPAADLLGKTLDASEIPAAVVEAWKDSIKGLFETGEALESSLTHEDRVYESRFVTVTGDGPATVILRDITIRRRIEKDLQEARGRLTSMLDGINGALAVLDRDWRVTYVNNCGVDLAGRKREELIGGNFWALFPSQAGVQSENPIREGDESPRAGELSGPPGAGRPHV